MVRGYLELKARYADLELGNDFPFAMLYSLKSSSIDWERPFILNQALNAGLAKLESHIGVRMSKEAPVVHDLLMQNAEFLETFEQVCKSGHIDTFNLASRPSIASGIMEENPRRGFGDQTRLSVLIPIESIAHKGVNAVLFVGINPRRPYDANYESFIRGLSRSISSSLASLILMNEQKRAVGEALEMEKRALAMLEASPVGSCLLDMAGLVLYANKSVSSLT